MEVCIARASAAVVQHVPPEAEAEFKQWQRRVTAAVECFPGYQGTDLYPPAIGSGDEWVTVIHFEDEASLQDWLDSSERGEMGGEITGQCGRVRTQNADRRL